MTSVHFSPTACLGLWLLASVQVDGINLTTVLILDTSSQVFFFAKLIFDIKKFICMYKE